MKNLKNKIGNLITKGTRDSLKKLTVDELKEAQTNNFLNFALISARQLAMEEELSRRKLEVDMQSIDEVIQYALVKISKDNDLFNLKGS